MSSSCQRVDTRDGKEISRRRGCLCQGGISIDCACHAAGCAASCACCRATGCAASCACCRAAGCGSGRKSTRRATRRATGSRATGSRATGSCATAVASGIKRILVAFIGDVVAILKLHESRAERKLYVRTAPPAANFAADERGHSRTLNPRGVHLHHFLCNQMIWRWAGGNDGRTVEGISSTDKPPSLWCLAALGECLSGRRGRKLIDCLEILRLLASIKVTQ